MSVEPTIRGRIKKYHFQDPPSNPPVWEPYVGVRVSWVLNGLAGTEATRQQDGHPFTGSFLVPKPNGDWRFVLDFQGLNKATTNVERWPIPNINELLRRIGDKKPRYFGIMDLTSGFFQASISAESFFF